MSDTLIKMLQADASALDIKITAQEIAEYLSRKKVPPEHLAAMSEFMSFFFVRVHHRGAFCVQKV